MKADVRVLVADDDAQLRLMLRHVLARAGYRVAEAGDGNEALALLERAPCDLALIDLVMPNKEGLETILDIRRRFPEVKILAMSGGARLHAEDPLKLARDCGADAVMAKPFLPAELLAMLARLSPEA